ncbi:phospholipid phosphatase 1-like [Argonauta hians]
MPPLPDDITRDICLIVSDLCCIMIVAIPCIILGVVGKPFQRGFFCDDESIKYPYRESTIPTSVLVVVGTSLNIVVMIIGESVAQKNTRQYVCLVGKYKRNIPTLVGRLYSKIGVYVFGAMSTYLLTDLAKYSIGRLRPHFLDVCRPDKSTYNCSSGYITSFTCTNTNAALIKDSRLSFASGHSSFGMYSMLFLAMYIHVTLPAKLGSTLKALLGLIAISLGLYTCYTRISDYKHHWSDVLGGALLGITVCLLVIFKLSDFFPMENRDHYDSNRDHYEYKIPDARSISQASSNSGCETAVTLDNHR